MTSEKLEIDDDETHTEIGNKMLMETTASGGLV